jgi:hypothetical protein
VQAVPVDPTCTIDPGVQPRHPSTANTNPRTQAPLGRESSTGLAGAQPALHPRAVNAVRAAFAAALDESRPRRTMAGMRLG